MSLDKAIQHGKEKRKPYYRSGKFDPTCRPNGGCTYCENGRQHKHRKKMCNCEEQIKELSLEEKEQSS